jgi:hypothetical protein
MTQDEIGLFDRVITATDSLLEFGCGGSTHYASTRVKRRIVTLDSSVEWLNKVAEACKAAGGIEPKTVYVDIGPTGAWGKPTDPATRDRWPAYHAQIWETEDAKGFDTILVDGRFRVACFLQTLLRCRPEASILFHDFGIRPGYQVVREFADEVEVVNTLSVFRAKPGFDVAKATETLQKYAYNLA